MTDKKIKEIIEKVCKNQRRRDKQDLRNQMNPLYDVEQSVSDVTLNDLLDLHEAIANICSKEALNLYGAEKDKEIEELKNKLCENAVELTKYDEQSEKISQFLEKLNKFLGYSNKSYRNKEGYWVVRVDYVSDKIDNLTKEFDFHNPQETRNYGESPETEEVGTVDNHNSKTAPKSKKNKELGKFVDYLIEKEDKTAPDGCGKMYSDRRKNKGTYGKYLFTCGVEKICPECQKLNKKGDEE